MLLLRNCMQEQKNAHYSCLSKSMDASPLVSALHTQPVSSFRNWRYGGGSVARVTSTRVGFSRKMAMVCDESQIGRQPIEVPSNVTITLEDQKLKVKGPLGELSRAYPREVRLERDENGMLRVWKAVETRRAHQMHGLFRTLTDNMVVGVTKGFEKRLLVAGKGYRATIEGKDLLLNLGLSHPVRMPISDDLKVKLETVNLSDFSKEEKMSFKEENRDWMTFTAITISGYDKCSIGDFAASLRKCRPPNPYVGFGVRYAYEVIKLKLGKEGRKNQR